MEPDGPLAAMDVGVPADAVPLVTGSGMVGGDVGGLDDAAVLVIGHRVVVEAVSGGGHFVGSFAGVDAASMDNG
jgi:hypothetical protein